MGTKIKSLELVPSNTFNRDEMEGLKKYLLSIEPDISFFGLMEIINWQPPKGTWKKKRMYHFKKFLDDNTKQNK